ncbi:MAG TPA: PAS domain-containing protein [Longimicrobiaceae bacterium]|nr:PAS domain-containing protein [Longimicrobiaceae bacterium]
MQPPRRIEESILRAAMEMLEDGFCSLDSHWRITYVNAAAERAFARSREELLGRVLWEALPKLRGSAVGRQLLEAAAVGQPRRFVERNPSGAAPAFASIHVAPMPGGGLAVHFRDVTGEIERAEQYSALLESIRDGFLAVDAGWQIVYLNSVAESLLRFSRDRAIGLSIWSLLPRGPAEIGECLRATMSDGIQRHLREVRPVGRVFRGRIFDLWTYPLAGGGLSLLFEDVSDRVQRERELARLAAEANEANQAKSRFFAAISHELRTPLNAIVGYTHLLHTQTYGEMPEGARRAAERAGICAEHLARLVDDVLLMTTAEIGRLPVNPSPIRLQQYMPLVLAAMRDLASAKGLGFEIHIPADLPVVETDPQRLRQLLNSLLSNAVKFTGRGTVRVEARMGTPAGPNEDGELAILPQPFVEISVVDSGPGVAEEDQERIFGPFEQTGDPARSQSMTRGSGLGLSIARQLAALLRGGLYLAETSPRGSRFCVRLPVAFGPTGDGVKG